MVRHHQAMDGTWSWALEPYYDEDITKELTNPRLEALFEVEDMLCGYYVRIGVHEISSFQTDFKERLTMPKIFILATGDEFFYPQDLDTYWDDIPDPKYIMYVYYILSNVSTFPCHYVPLQDEPECSAHRLPSLR